MCAPIALGVASFAAGAMGAVGQHQSAHAQAHAANVSATRNYKYQLKMRERAWDRDRHIYGQQIHEYNAQKIENDTAAQRAYSAEQRKLNEAYMEAAIANQGMAVNLLKGTGGAAAANRTGRSAERLDNNMLAQYGRNQAILAQSLTSAGQAYDYGVRNIRQELRASNRAAWSNVAIAPQPGVAPPKPVMQQGPSGIQLMAGLGQAAISGYGTYNSLKAPPAYV